MKKIRIGVLGVSGHFLKRVFPPLRDAEFCEVHGIASRRPEAARDAAHRLGIPRAYGSYEELVKDGEIDLVYIPLPNDLHKEWIKRCADSGKDIICEKPITLNAEEAADCEAYAKAKGVRLMEAFMYKFHPQWIRAKELVDQGEIGAVTAIHTFFSYMNTDPKNIRNKTENGGGALMDIGCYAVSSARFILGKEPLRAVSLITRDPGFGIDSHTSGILDFGGSRCLFTSSTQADAFQRVEIHGTAGFISVNIPFNPYTDVPVTIDVVTKIGPRSVSFGPVDQYRNQFDACAKAVIEGKPFPVEAADAVANMKAIDALFASAESGSWEKV